MRTVLLAGATGMLGRHVARELTAEGFSVRRLVRRDPGAGDWLADLRWAPSLRGAVEGSDAVISCAGASMTLGGWRDRASFMQVDFEGNRNLIEAANRTGVRKFVYVSLAHGPALVQTEYARAHERTVQFLAATGLRYTVVRPTGFFGFFGEILRMAEKGRGMVVGDGSARTNPIHEADAARACVDALSTDSECIAAGGPDIYTRREIVELAFRTLGRPPRVSSLSSRLLGPVVATMRPLNPRIAALVEFGTAVSQDDCLAPAYGLQRLDAYFTELFRSAAADQKRPNSAAASS